MNVFPTLERRLGWLSFPGILRYYTLMHVLVFVLQLMRPDISRMLDFDRKAILSGELWRLFTCFFATSEFFRGNLFLSLLFLFFVINFMFMISDGLEGEWGVFKSSLFCYFGMLCILIGAFLFPYPPFPGLMIYSSAFLAFATIYPKMEIRLFMILPVPVGLLGIISGAIMLLTCIGMPVLFPFYLFATLNYFLWIGIPALRGKAREAQSAQRRAKFKAQAKPQAEAFHTCIVCGRTDTSDPQLDFRVDEDGNERCSDHLES